MVEKSRRRRAMEAKNDYTPKREPRELPAGTQKRNLGQRIQEEIAIQLAQKEVNPGKKQKPSEILEELAALDEMAEEDMLVGSPFEVRDYEKMADDDEFDIDIELSNAEALVEQLQAEKSKREEKNDGESSEDSSDSETGEGDS